MTNEKMLEVLYKLRALSAQGDGSEAARVLIDAENQLKEDIRHDCQKSRGLAKRDKLVTKVMNSASLTVRPLLRGWHACKNGKKAFCDGYRLYASDDNFGFEKAADQINADLLLPTGNTVPLTVDSSELKAYIKEQKALVRSKAQKDVHPFTFDAGSFRIGFNPQYLLEFCQFFNTDTIYAVGPCSAAQYLDLDSGDWGILLPCRVPQN